MPRRDDYGEAIRRFVERTAAPVPQFYREARLEGASRTFAVGLAIPLGIARRASW